MVVDLNADLGEGFPHDDVLLGLVTSANVACGFHAGSDETMAATCKTAAARGVAVGAHPSFRDRDGFGRRDLDVPVDVLRTDVAEQVAALAAAADAAGTRVAYVKPHGALYHRAAVDRACAAAVASVAAEHALAILGWPGSLLLEEAREAGVAAVAEGFADRAYTVEGRLVSRDRRGAVLDAAAAARQAVELVRRGEVGSICVHGDGDDPPAVAARVRAALEAEGVELKAFA